MRARLSGVTKSHGAQVVLENVSLEVGPRARIGLVGPNGVGGGDLDARAAATCAPLGLGLDLDRPFDGLSGGEAARASLAAVLLAQADLLVLDEPTNHLDLEAVAQLEQAFAGSDGALVVVSHDRRFLDDRRTPTRTLARFPDRDIDRGKRHE